MVADLSNRNPNVLYEIGIAHALSIDVIMMVQDEDDVPFDLRHLRYISYSPGADGIGALEGKLAQFIEDTAGEI